MGQPDSFLCFPAVHTVKDNRTGVETGNIQGVMDGDLNPFIEGYLKMNKFNSKAQ